MLRGVEMERYGEIKPAYRFQSHFDELAALYNEIRPAYPIGLMTDILAYCNEDTRGPALEIGAGTGIATSFFLDAGFAVTAVEPGLNMAEILKARFSGKDNFSVAVSRFEDIALRDASYGLIYAATAFHWVDVEIGCPKVFRLLKHGGVFAVFRYNMVPIKSDELHQAIQEVYRKYFIVSEKKPDKISRHSSEINETKSAFGFEGLEPYGFDHISIKTYNASQKFSTDEYLALLETFPDHASLPVSNRAALYEGIKDAIAKHGGVINVNYIFKLYMGRKP